MTGHKEISHVLDTILDGDVEKVDELTSFSAEDVASATSGEVVLEATAVARVLQDFRDGRRSAEQVQRWANFVRWGSVPASTGVGLHSVDIAFAPEREDAIATALERLDELGDLIDGQVDSDEIDDLLTNLRP